MSDHAVSQANEKLSDLTWRYDEIPPLPNVPDRYYAIPPSPRAKLEYRGLSLDQLEDLLANSPAWRQAKRITHAPKPEFAGRPLTSLHQGHVALYGQAVRFGLPVLPEWAEWFSVELRRRGMVEELVGLNCDPIAVKGTKLRLLRILSQGLRRKAIAIPSEVPAVVAPARAVSNLA
jgi:hypothetical protein